MILSPSQPDVLNNSGLSELEIKSDSLLMQDIYVKILSLAKTESPIIIVGENGTGKNRLAKIIHKNSTRANCPFYSFCCIDIDEEKYKEAFWGQLEMGEDLMMVRYHAIENAERGTLFLDHFSELSQEYMYKIVSSYFKGCKQLFRYSTHSVPRLVISIDQKAYHDILITDLGKKIFELLDPFVVVFPPLRERKEDIPKLVSHFINDIKSENENWDKLNISKEAMEKCTTYNWPGNMRQLKSALMHGAVLANGKTIETIHLPINNNLNLSV